MSSMVDLQRDLREMQDENKDIVKSIQLNAEAQHLALFQDSNLSTLSEESKDNLIRSFQQENEHLRNLIEKMTSDRNLAQSKAILIQQQSEENESFKIMLRQQLDESLKEIRKTLFEKESVIQQIEISQGSAFPANPAIAAAMLPPTQMQNPNEPIIADATNLILHREVLAPSVATFKIHLETEALRKEISKTVQQIEQLKQRKKKILNSTQDARFQIDQLKNCINSKMHKKRNCLIQQQTSMSDDEDYNLSHCKSRVDDFQKEKIRRQIFDERRALVKRGLIPRNHRGPLNSAFNDDAQVSPLSSRNQSISSESEKLKRLTAIWRVNNEKKVAAIQVMQQYNQTLEKSNEQLIDNYNQLQQKTTELTANLHTYKESYTQLINRKKFRSYSQSSTLATLSSHNNHQIASAASLNTPSLLSNNLNQEVTSSNAGSQKSHARSETKDLRSVKEEEDEEVRQKHSSKQQLQSQRGPSYLSAFDDPADIALFPSLYRKKACIAYLYKIKQQLDKLCKQVCGFAHSQPIPPRDPRFISVSTIPPSEFRVRRSLSDPTDCTEKRDAAAVWSIQKRLIRYYIHPSEFMHSDNDEEDDDDDDEEDDDVLNDDDDEDDDEDEEGDVVGDSSGEYDPNNDEQNMDQNQKRNKKKRNKFQSQAQHNNSFFRELDISAIHKSKK